MTEIITAIFSGIFSAVVAFICFTVKIDKRVALLEQSVELIASNLEKYSDIQLRLIKQEMSIEQLESSMEELRNGYKELRDRLAEERRRV